MDSDGDDPKGPGFPIRISTDQSSFAAPHGFSQRTTSFIASRCQGIHQTPLRRLIDPTSNGQRPKIRHPRPRPQRQDLVSILLPSQHDRTIQQSGIEGPPRTTSTRNPLPDRARPVITLFTMSNSRHAGTPRACPDPTTARQGNLCFRDRAAAPPGTPDRPAAWVMVGQGRLELPTSRLSSARSNQLSYWPTNRTSAHHRPSLPLPLGNGGGGRVRTDDLRLAKPSLSQLSYAPMRQPAASLSGAASRGLDREGMRRRRSRGHSPVRDRDDCFQPDP